jgi:hypothetical protein
MMPARGGVLRLSWWLLTLLSGCAYVTRQEFLDQWDTDGDGWPDDEDCAPRDKNVYPYAPDVRGDGCDSDCGTELDTDGDDFPDAADCGPEDPDIFPCSPAEIDGDDIDHDCDAATTVRTAPCDGADPDYPDEEVVCEPVEEGE